MNVIGINKQGCYGNGVIKYKGNLNIELVWQSNGPVCEYGTSGPFEIRTSNNTKFKSPLYFGGLSTLGLINLFCGKVILSTCLSS